jgi:hypothetical protein
MQFQTYYGPQSNLIILVIALLLLVIVVVFFNRRKGVSGFRHWTVAAIKVAIVFILWQSLSFFVYIIIMIYTSGPEELRLFRISIVSMLIFIGLLLFLILIETRHSSSYR